MSARPFGTTPNEEIAERFRALPASNQLWYSQDSPLWLSESDFLDLMDTLEYTAFTATRDGMPSLAKWARVKRIAILAELGLEEATE